MDAPDLERFLQAATPQVVPPPTGLQDLTLVSSQGRCCAPGGPPLSQADSRSSAVNNSRQTETCHGSGWHAEGNLQVT